jgi:hypothetical protein
MATVRENVPDENFAIDLGSLGALAAPAALAVQLLMSFLTGAATIAAMVPLFSVLYLLIKRGLAGLNWAAFTDLPPAAMMDGGGFGERNRRHVGDRRDCDRDQCAAWDSGRRLHRGFWRR